MNKLNQEQQSGISAAGNGHVAVVAGPGTGKTHTLIGAVLDRLAAGVKADEILVLTFTNKAADELTARLKKSRHGKLPLATTFHAWAYRQIKSSLGDKKLIDNFTQRQLLLELKKQTGTKQTVRELSLMIGRCKNGSDQTEKSRKLLEMHDALLKRDNLIDFDDLLRLYLKSDHEPTYQRVFVDEFQDTSPLQYQVLERFMANGSKLFIIGDPNQSIYGFRGAGGETFEKFIAEHQPITIRLTQNYRSTRSIVAAGAAVFPDAGQQPVNQKSGNVQIIETLDVFSEADYVIRSIEHALGGTDWSVVHHDEKQLIADHFRDFALLYRHNRQGKRLAEKLRSAGLPVQVTGEDSPYATPLAQAVLASFRYLVDMNKETEQQVIVAVLLLGYKDSLTWLEALDTTQPPDKLTLDIIKGLGKTDEIEQFQPVLNTLAAQPDLKTAVAHWQAIAEQDFYDPQADCITLSTIHASKGLEFRHVFMVDCNEDVLPHKKGDKKEEKRLFYVAVTRAIESLTLLHCRKIDGKPAKPSHFLNSLPTSITRQIDPEFVATEKRRAKAKQKRAQQSLF